MPHSAHFKPQHRRTTWTSAWTNSARSRPVSRSSRSRATRWSVRRCRWSPTATPRACGCSSTRTATASAPSPPSSTSSWTSPRRRRTSQPGYENRHRASGPWLLLHAHPCFLRVGMCSWREHEAPNKQGTRLACIPCIERQSDMKIENVVAEALGLKIGNAAQTAMVDEAAGFEGRRIYVNAAPPFAEWSGATLHLSGFTPEECELLGAVPNQLVTSKAGKKEYFASARVSGFLKLTEENLKQAAGLVKGNTHPAWSRSGGETTAQVSEAQSILAAIAASK